MLLNLYTVILCYTIYIYILCIIMYTGIFFWSCGCLASGPFESVCSFCAAVGLVKYVSRGKVTTSAPVMHCTATGRSNSSLGFCCGLGIHVRRALWSRMCISFNNIMPGTAAEQKMSLNFEIWVLFCKMQGVCMYVRSFPNTQIPAS